MGLAAFTRRRCRAQRMAGRAMPGTRKQKYTAGSQLARWSKIFSHSSSGTLVTASSHMRAFSVPQKKMDDLLVIQTLKSLPKAKQQEIQMQVALTGKLPSVQEIVKMSLGDRKSFGKTKAGKLVSDALADTVPYCKPQADGKVNPVDAQGNIVCRDDILNFKKDCPEEYNLMEKAVGSKYIHWNMWMLNEMLVNWRQNKTDTLQRLLMKLAYLSAVVVKEGGKNISPFYYPIESICFITWVMKFYEPVELKVTLNDALFPALGDQKKEIRKYYAEAVRGEINNKLQISALVAASVPGDCKPDPARMGGAEPPYDPNQCIAAVRMGGDFRLWFSKPNIGRNGEILDRSAKWTLLTPKMKNPSLLQVLKGAGYQNDAQISRSDRQLFTQNLTKISNQWQGKLNDAVKAFEKSGNMKDLKRFQELAEVNPMDETIALSKRLSNLDEKSRKLALQNQRLDQQKSVAQAMVNNRYDNDAFVTAGYSAFNPNSEDPLSLKTTQGLIPQYADVLQQAGQGSSKALAKGRKAKLPAQSLSRTNLHKDWMKPTFTKSMIEREQQQLLMQMLGATTKPDYKPDAEKLWKGWREVATSSKYRGTAAQAFWKPLWESLQQKGTTSLQRFKNFLKFVYGATKQGVKSALSTKVGKAVIVALIAIVAAYYGSDWFTYNDSVPLANNFQNMSSVLTELPALDPTQTAKLGEQMGTALAKYSDEPGVMQSVLEAGKCFMPTDLTLPEVGSGSCPAVYTTPIQNLANITFDIGNSIKGMVSGAAENSGLFDLGSSLRGMASGAAENSGPFTDMYSMRGMVPGAQQAVGGLTDFATSQGYMGFTP